MDVIVIAGTMVMVYLTAVLLVGCMVTFSHPLPLLTLSQAYPFISAFSNPIIAREMLGLSVNGVGSMESQVSSQVAEGCLPICHSTVPSSGKYRQQSQWDASSLFQSFSQS